MSVLPRLSYKWRVWFHGIVAAFLGAIANSMTNAIVDPEHFNPLQHGDWSKMGISLGVAGVIGVALYLKTHPLPDPDKDTDAYQAADQQIAALAGATDTVVRRDHPTNSLHM